MKTTNIRNMMQTALLGAMALFLHLWRFPLPFMPPFMDFDLSGIAEMIGAYTMGPLSGFTIIILKNLLKFMIQGTSSGGTGELQNIMLSSVYVLTASLIFRRGGKSRKASLIGMVVGTLVCATTAVFTNMYIIIPFFAKAFGMTMESIVAMVQKVNPYVDSTWKFIALGIIPFNLIKGSVTTLVIYLTYPALMRIASGGRTDAVQ